MSNLAKIPEPPRVKLKTTNLKRSPMPMRFVQHRGGNIVYKHTNDISLFQLGLQIIWNFWGNFFIWTLSATSSSSPKEAHSQQ